MFYLISWLAVLSLVALWSLAAWLLHGAALWVVTSAGAATGAAAAGMAGQGLPQWLAAWVPPDVAQAIASLLSGLVPVVESLLQAAPALGGVLTGAGWVVWGLGCALLVLLGAGLHVAIALWRRGSDGAGRRSLLAAG
ncbi:conserved hypothetical protein [Rubrivivax sp. A210]|uniref:hypothetical protein n=1 Tax=Rubrivivax sp. A210 TaxID=2772301 RepID=UPI001919A757|nr:hypothetical protein [Rubrivivax sp. A210]CAD5372738.1 conserved hypothetical protein [Rubrivivax sp. A210]